MLHVTNSTRTKMQQVTRAWRIWQRFCSDKFCSTQRAKIPPRLQLEHVGTCQNFKIPRIPPIPPTCSPRDGAGVDCMSSLTQPSNIQFGFRNQIAQTEYLDVGMALERQMNTEARHCANRRKSISMSHPSNFTHSYKSINKNWVYIIQESINKNWVYIIHHCQCHDHET